MFSFSRRAVWALLLLTAVCAVGVVSAPAGLSATPKAKPAGVVPPLIVVKIPDDLGKGTLTCFPGIWKNAPTSYQYQWLRDDVEIAGATHPKYTITAADEGHDLACRVTAKNAKGSATATSLPFPLPGAETGTGAFPDHFHCYRVVRQISLAKTRFVSLDDQFLSGANVEVDKPQWLCNPVSKDNGGIQHPLGHLVCYRSIQPGFAQRTVRIDNQFGSQIATATNTETLCVPSLKRVDGGPLPLSQIVKRKKGRPRPPTGADPAAVLDHYRCYRVIPQQPAVRRIVSLGDQLGTTIAQVGRLVQLCNPVSKSHEPVKNPSAHLACYLTDDALIPRFIRGNFVGAIKRKVAWDVEVSNQFGKPADRFTVYEAVAGLGVPGAELLCVPSLKTELNQQPGQTPPPLKCQGTLTYADPNNHNAGIQFGLSCDAATTRFTLKLNGGVNIDNAQPPSGFQCQPASSDGAHQDTIACQGSLAAGASAQGLLHTNPAMASGAGAAIAADRGSGLEFGGTATGP